MRDVICELAEVSPDIAEDVIAALSQRHRETEQAERDLDDAPIIEGGVDVHSSYKERRSIDTSNLKSQWERFGSNLKYENRHFNRQGEELFQFLFEGLDSHTTNRGDPIVVRVEPGTPYSILYRARQFEGESELRTALR